MSEEIQLPRHWVAKARNDLLNADNNLKAEDVMNWLRNALPGACQGK